MAAPLIHSTELAAHAYNWVKDQSHAGSDYEAYAEDMQDALDFSWFVVNRNVEDETLDHLLCRGDVNLKIEWRAFLDRENSR